MRFLLVLIGLTVGAVGGIWSSFGLFPEADPGVSWLMGAGLSFGLGCWAYLGTHAADGRRPDLERVRTWLALAAIGLGVAAIHMLLLIAAYAIAQR